MATVPQPNDNWDPSSKLHDSSSDGSMLAEAEGSRVAISATNAGRVIRFIQVFSETKPADYYADDVINVVRFSPDGKLLAAGTGQAVKNDSGIPWSKDHSVHIWSVADGSPIYTLTDPLSSVRTLAWSPDGRYLAAGGGYEPLNGHNVVRVWRIDARPAWEAAPPTLAYTFIGHVTTVEALAWSPDGRRLVSRDVNGVVVIWRVP